MRRVGPADKQIGERIRARRTFIGMSQTDVGVKLDVTFQQVQKYESGVNRVSGHKLVLLADALHTTPGALLGAGEPEKADELYKLMNNAGAMDFLKTFAHIKPATRRKCLALLKTIVEE